MVWRQPLQTLQRINVKNEGSLPPKWENSLLFFNEPFPKASGRTKHFACLVLQDKDQVTMARIRAMIRRTGGDWRLSTSEFKSHVSIFMEVK